jgi:WD40 repeat protein
MIIVEKIDTFGGHRESVYALAKSAEKKYFFSAAGDGVVVRWNLENPDIGELIARVPNSIYSMAFDDKRSELWVGQNFEGVHIIDPVSKQEIRSLKLSKAAIFDIQLFDNQGFIAGGDGVISVIDLENFVFKKHIKASEKSVRCIAINPVEREFAAGYSDNTIGIFDLRDFSLKKLINAHMNSVFTLKYSPDFRFLLSGGRDAHLKIWNVEENYSLEKDIVAHLFAINNITYSPNGEQICTCSMDKSLKIWDAESFKLQKVIDRARHAGHGTSINKVLWSEFENLLISCSDDRTISVWKLL